MITRKIASAASPAVGDRPRARDGVWKAIVVTNLLITAFLVIRFLQRGLVSISVTSFLAGVAFFLISCPKITKRLESSNPAVSLLRWLANLARRRPLFNFAIMSALMGILMGLTILLLLIASMVDLHQAVLFSNEVAAYVFLFLVLGVFGEVLSSGLFREKT